MEKGYTEPDILKKSETFTSRRKKERECGSGRRKACDGCREVRLLYTLREEMPAGSDPCGKKEKVWKLDEEKCVECGICAGHVRRRR